MAATAAAPNAGRRCTSFDPPKSRQAFAITWWAQVSGGCTGRNRPHCPSFTGREVRRFGESSSRPEVSGPLRQLRYRFYPQPARQGPSANGAALLPDHDNLTCPPAVGRDGFCRMSREMSPPRSNCAVRTALAQYGTKRGRGHTNGPAQQGRSSEHGINGKTADQ